MSNLIRLEALALTAKVPSYVTYTDHGFVSNMNTFAKAIYAQKGFDAPLPSTACGKCMVFMNTQAVSSGVFAREFPAPWQSVQMDIHIGYVQQANLSSNLLIRGHEEGHAADELYRMLNQPFLLDALEKKLAREQGARLSLRQIREKEVLADILGIYAMRRFGFDRFDLRPELRTAAFVEAYARYTRAMR